MPVEDYSRTPRSFKIYCSGNRYGVVTCRHIVSSVIVDWRRTPFSRSHKGELSEVRPDEFASQVLVELLNNLNIDPAEIDDVIVGCAYPEGEQGYNIGRLMALMSGLPKEAPGVPINMHCGSSMQAIINSTENISAYWG